MKAQILKLAGVKNDAEFYKKFPSEEAFMKKHGKALKKAQVGASIEAAKTANAKPINYNDIYAQAEATNTGVSVDEKKRQDALAAAASKQSTQPSGMAGMIGGAMKAFGGGNGDIIGNIGGMFAHGGYLPIAQDGLNAGFFGDTTSNFGFDAKNADPFNAAVSGANSMGGSGGGASSFKDAGNALLGQAGSIIGNIQAIGQMQKQQDQQKQFAKISDVTAQAAESQDIDANRQKRYVRPEDMPIQQGQLGNPYGSGTNYLQAKNGAEIQNTFAPNTIYTDMGYEPLNDSNPKQFQFGGVASGLGSWVTGGGFQESPEGMIGSVAGKTIGSLIPIPGASQVLEGVGGLVGGLFGGARQHETNNYAEQGKQNTMRAAGAGFGNALRNMNSGVMEDGGWVSNDWMPQVITKFGDYNMDELLAPPHDADMLRSGGHLQSYTPPSAEAMYTGRAEYGTQMAMGGDLQVHRGEAETLSYNPFLPDGGETIMFRGPSHDNGGMPVSFGQNGVEVEGGEPAVKLQDGGSPDGNLVVYGNMLIPDYGVTEINDPNAKGKKFKNYINDLSKVEAKQNKIVEKHTDSVNDLNVVDTFDKFSLQSSQASIIGANMKLKDIATKKLDTAAVQNAILDTAKEHGLESDALAKGKIKALKSTDKYAKFGAKLTVAQDGLNATKFYEQQQAQQNMINNWPGEPVLNTIETPPIPLDYTEGYQQIQSNQDLANGWPRAADSKQSIAGLLDLMKSKGIDTSISSGTRTGATTKQGKPSRHAVGEAIDVKFPALGKTAYEAMLGDKDIVGYMLTNNLTAIDEYNPNVAKKTGATGGHVHIGLDKGTGVADAFRKQAATRHPAIAAAVKGAPAVAAVKGAPVKGTSIKGAPIAAVPAVAQVAPTTLTNKTIAPMGTSNLSTLPNVTQPTANVQASAVPSPRDYLGDAMTAVQTFAPYLRPTNQQPLDPSQLSGEMLALSQNQIEPVQAQMYTPQLNTPYDISLQDKLNANQSDFNAIQRQAGGNPEALAALAAQKYAANSQVLGEQFRANQAEKAQVYGENRNLLNQAQLQNIGALDVQSQRQSQARSNTKQQAQVALNSISDKISKNKLENRTLGVYENMYNYRFGADGKAYNVNAPQQWNPAGNASTTPSKNAGGTMQDALGNTLLPDYDTDGTIKTYKVQKAAKRNGAIVKAIKNL